MLLAQKRLLDKVTNVVLPTVKLPTPMLTVIGVMKTIKDLDDEATSYKQAGKAEQAEQIEKQKEIISKYLPQLLSEDEIYKIIEAQPDKSIPTIMNYFKANYAGKVDMAKVGIVLKKFN